jgi:hypothetical protein
MAFLIISAEYGDSFEVVTSSSFQILLLSFIRLHFKTSFNTV